MTTGNASAVSSPAVAVHFSTQKFSETSRKIGQKEVEEMSRISANFGPSVRCDSFPCLVLSRQDLRINHEDIALAYICIAFFQ